MKFRRKVIPTSAGHKQVDKCDPPHCGCAAPVDMRKIRKSLDLPAGAQRISISHVITRADGTQDVVAESVRYRNPLKDLWWQLRWAPAMERSIIRANHRAKALRD